MELTLIWRIDDNGTGTDHGSGGVAFCLGQPVNGGHYGEYPSLKESDRLEGDLRYNNDFRGVYSTILDRWLGVDPSAVIGGAFEAAGAPAAIGLLAGKLGY